MTFTNTLRNTSLLACTALMALAFCACGNDNEEPKPASDNNVSSVKFTYGFTVNRTVFDVSQTNITYTDGNDKEKTETMSDTAWTKTIVCKNFPVTLTIKVSHSLKDGIDSSKKYDIYTDLNYKYEAYNVKGSLIGGDSQHIKGRTEGVKAENLANILVDDSYTWHIDAKGKIKR